jgi:hypothetical protein
LLRRTVVFAVSLAVGSVGMVASFVGPVSAAGLPTCTSVKGGAELTPGISSTTHSSAVSVGDEQHPGPATLSGCTGGGVTGGTLTFSGTTIPGNCNTLGNPTPGQVVITGTFTITWAPSGSTSGKLSAASTSNPLQVKLKLKATGGLFNGHKGKDTTGFALETETPPQDCVNKPVDDVNTTNASNLVFK